MTRQSKNHTTQPTSRNISETRWNLIESATKSALNSIIRNTVNCDIDNVPFGVKTKLPKHNSHVQTNALKKGRSFENFSRLP